MSDLWFYGQDGTQRGPVEFAALKALADGGTLRRTDLVWREGMADWVPAQTMIELFPTPAVAPVIEPTSPPPNAPVVPPPAAPPLQPTVPAVPQYAQPLSYDAGAYNANDQNGRAVAALVLGICSLPACLCPFIGVALGITAIVLGSGVKPGPNKGLAVGGVVCGIIGTLIGLPQSANIFLH